MAAIISLRNITSDDRTEYLGVAYQKHKIRRLLNR
jgi:hypothetical protein